MFRGVNSVNKAFPWYDSSMLEDERIATLASGGFNVVRLGAMWTGFEPEKGQFNETYRDILKVLTVEQYLIHYSFFLSKRLYIAVCSIHL